MAIAFEQLRIEPAYRQVATALLERITDRSLKTGDRLPSENELARQFGVNRSTVREALRELQSSGVLGRERGSKLMTVTRPAPRKVGEDVSRALHLHDASAFDVWEGLTIVEPAIAERAAERRSEADLLRLQAAAAEFRGSNRAAGAAAERVSEYFRALASAAANPVLELAQEPLVRLLQPSLAIMINKVSQARERIAAAQERIATAVEARNSDQAREWMAKHIRDFRRGYELAGIDLERPVAIATRR
ncbi:MAG: GntR family transcriptional regulator [Steroidobacteraceae bacterium]